MSLISKEEVWGQFGAAIEMLENAIMACPDALWSDASRNPQFWYLAYHTLFFLDFYSSGTDRGFAPPAPFTLSEMDPAGVMPERVYSREELKRYLEHGRAQCMAEIVALDPKRASQRCAFERRDISVAELLLYNLRHVQHHAAQLNLILRQVVDEAPGWVSKSARTLEAK
ncbi:MAG: DinB family protein [Candidatus Eiseniibacteriota bacterium]